ncbi:methylated-DNA--[protein]-cysteine S-methyltransferase [Bartonella schoenbuchensis]|uniref:Methyltransferase n=1 Tax=Bartonella schoenbuchensis (strain DSM 13525 / NCTC 13165 / R1) TaxID=687861 RepID=E6YY95_BARSR|nr:methylated-DNA--[protein]-cysteine S-methyltransferase [Bartonella schoenbuchensis]AQX30376.1 DNA-O6-methylguanine--protein-cysteine S-methyltransferase [Bartonella schoenbuchensis R1]CBI81906.1 Methyltransferase [Bartonella schoenbuchensis R1]
MIGLKNKNSQDAIVVILKETSIGVLLIAKSRKGICNIALGDTAEQLLQELKITNVQYNIDDNVLNREIAHIVAMVETPKLVEHHDLQLDIKGTAFQQKVWGALCEIQCGETVSYKELAQHIGMPKAVRAVANACAHNKLALVIPCHRVIYKNGAIAGYRWGIQRKQILLHRERQEYFV